VASYFLAFAWGIVVLLSLVGWGGVLNRLLFPKDQTDWGQRGAWGLALSVVVGGILNLLSCISRTTILTYLGVGMAAWVLGSLVRRPLRSKSTSQSLPGARSHKALVLAGVLIVACLALIRYGASISVVRCDARAIRLNCFSVDDFQGYFAFPEKMLQAGSMGRDPFCSRRLESSLGGQSFLDTFVLSTLSVHNLHSLDFGIGLLLVIGLLWGDFNERGTPPAWCLLVLLFFLLRDPAAINITSCYTGLALFLSLTRTLAWKALPASRFLSRILVIALLGAAVCSLKSSFIPACGVLLACSYLCYVVGQNFKRHAVLELVSTAVLVVAFALPWMISLYQSSGTLLYPLLGKGYHQSAYGNSLSPYAGLTISRSVRLILQPATGVLFVALCSLGVFYLATRRPSIQGREAVLSLLLAATFGQIIITLATNDVSDGVRYSFPFVLAAILVLMAEATSGRTDVLGREKLKAFAPLVVVAVTFFVVGSSWDPAKVMYVDCIRTIRLGLENISFISAQEAAEYQKLQQSIPLDEVVLTRLEKPFVLDFKRNTVFLVDEANASPPPGMPFFKGSEPLARYLVSQSIRYVAYSYGYEANVPANVLAGYPPWIHTIVLHTNDLQDNLIELGRTRRRIYDDGRNFVLDLLEPRVGEAAQGFYLWCDGEARGREADPPTHRCGSVAIAGNTTRVLQAGELNERSVADTSVHFSVE
jgi:hypothetical protein